MGAKSVLGATVGATPAQVDRAMSGRRRLVQVRLGGAQKLATVLATAVSRVLQSSRFPRCKKRAALDTVPVVSPPRKKFNGTGLLLAATVPRQPGVLVGLSAPGQQYLAIGAGKLCDRTNPLDETSWNR